jgi:hypothetical protein
LEEGRHDLVSRGSLGEAVMDEEWTGGADSECGRLVLERGGRRPVTISCHESLGEAVMDDEWTAGPARAGMIDVREIRAAKRRRWMVARRDPGAG